MSEDKNKSISTESSEESTKTMFEIVVSQFKDHKAALIGFWIIVLFVLVSVTAPLISKMTGIDPDDQSVFNRYKPLMTRTVLGRDQQNVILENFATANPDRTKKLNAQFVKKGWTSAQTTGDPVDHFLDFTDARGDDFAEKIKALGTAESGELYKTLGRFSTFHVFGTDELGRDVFMRLIYGSRISMGVGLLVALASALIGTLIGSIAGYYGGWIDGVLMRITDSLIALPLLPLMIVFAAVDLQKLPVLGAIITGQNESIMKLVVILVLFSWMQAARLIRGSILSVREREFVLAAKTLGAKDSTIIRSHIVPNVIAPLLVAVTLNVGSAILWESALSFLGLGIQPPTPSWGNMLFNAQEIIHEAPSLAILPGMLIFITVICFNFVGDGLQDAVDPKAIRR